MKQILVQSSNVYRYNLYDEIEEFNNYSEFMEDLYELSENDAVALYINSPGGRLDVGVSLVNAVRNSSAPITAVIEGPSYSMASIIALSCKKLIMLNNTFLMFHNYSTMSAGKGRELMGMLRHNDNHFNKLLKQTCSPFLTKTELTQIASDQDVYIYSDDPTLEKRKERHFK